MPFIALANFREFELITLQHYRENETIKITFVLN